MKRHGHLIEAITRLDNLLLAFHKAKKGKTNKADVLAYQNRLETNLARLREQIISGDVATGGYHTFTIYDPKQRLICAAPFEQRVLHHALMNVCHPYFEKQQIYHSYASRPGKGVHAALDVARRHTARYAWFLKLDFRKYFDSLDHQILKRQLRCLFKDHALLHIFDAIIDSYETTAGKGVPIGNLTSQYFANHYLAGLDHYIKEILGIRAYIRYMDDQVLWHDDKKTLLEAGRQLQTYASTRLALSLKPFCLNRAQRGLPFLGYLLYPHKTRLSQRSRTRFVAKLRAGETRLASGEWDPKTYQRHVQPLIAFTEYADAREFRKRIIDVLSP